MVERQIERETIAVIQPWCAENKRSLVFLRQLKCQTLRRLVVIGTVVKQTFDEPNRGMIIEIVYQLHITPEWLGHFLVERFQRETGCFFGKNLVECLNSVCKSQHVRVLFECLFTKAFYFRDSAGIVIDERPSEVRGIFQGRHMHLRRDNERLRSEE